MKLSNKSFFVSIFLLLFFISNAFAFKYYIREMNVPSLSKKTVPGEIIVKFKSGVKDHQAKDVAVAMGSIVRESVHNSAHYKLIKVPAGMSVDKMIAKYRNNKNVEYVEPNMVCSAFAVPNDPGYGVFQWNFKNAAGGMYAEGAWDVVGGGSADVIIGVLDSGVAFEDYDIYAKASDLAETVFVQGYDYINWDEHPNDDLGHGTHVTGTLAQSTNNAMGVAGIAYNTKIMPVKVLDAYGNGSSYALAEGIRYAVDNGADVINMSLGWPAGYDPGTTLHDAVQYAYNKGVVLIAATGNSGASSLSYPAAYDEVIAVGATQYDETVTSYTNTGAGMEIVAPGGNSSLDQNGDGYPDGILQMSMRTLTSFGYYFYQGTSMASPHVAAVAALLVSNGISNPATIRQILRDTAVDHGTPGWDSEYGYGLLNAQAALNASASYANNAPIADAGGAYVGQVGDAVQFDGSASGDPDGDAITFQWDFGDGNTSTMETPSHTYALAGTFTVTLTVSDGELQSESSTTAEITAVQSPADPIFVVSHIALSVVPDRNRVKGNAIVTVTDANGIPLPGVTVSAHWSGVISQNVTLTTDADGKASSLSLKAKPSSDSFIFTIDDAVLSGYTFDAGNSILTESIVAQASTGMMSVFPNPANPQAKISYQVQTPGHVEIIVYNMIGQKVHHLVSDYHAAGIHEVVWDGKNSMGSSVVSGVYFVTLQTQDQMSTVRLMLTK